MLDEFSTTEYKKLSTKSMLRNLSGHEIQLSAACSVASTYIIQKAESVTSACVLSSYSCILSLFQLSIMIYVNVLDTH